MRIVLGFALHNLPLKFFCNACYIVAILHAYKVTPSKCQGRMQPDKLFIGGLSELIIHIAGVWMWEKLMVDNQEQYLTLSGSVAQNAAMTSLLNSMCDVVSMGLGSFTFQFWI